MKEVKMSPRRERLHEIIFESDTKAGKIFDIFLLIFIAISLIVITLESVSSINKQYNFYFGIIDWILTIIFTIEYLLRIYSIQKPQKYIFSFYGIIDFLSIAPIFLSLLFPGIHFLAVIRTLRLLRVFRVLKMFHFMNEGYVIIHSLRLSQRKIFVFLFFIIILVTIMGALMYVVEGPFNEKFSSIPDSIYWSIVTVTTVGYGDISPVTPLGKFLASLLMIIGYAILAVPTGIVTSELANLYNRPIQSTQACKNCSKEGHAIDAEYCKYCGTKL